MEGNGPKAPTKTRRRCSTRPLAAGLEVGPVEPVRRAHKKKIILSAERRTPSALPHFPLCLSHEQRIHRETMGPRTSRWRFNDRAVQSTGQGTMTTLLTAAVNEINSEDISKCINIYICVFSVHYLLYVPLF